MSRQLQRRQPFLMWAEAVRRGGLAWTWIGWAASTGDRTGFKYGVTDQSVALRLRAPARSREQQSSEESAHERERVLMDLDDAADPVHVSSITDITHRPETTVDPASSTLHIADGSTAVEPHMRSPSSTKQGPTA